MSNPNFVTREELLALIEGNAPIRLVDASWYLPAQNRDGKAEYLAGRIADAVYFDIDDISDKTTDLPHMLPTAEEFSKRVGAMGISENDDIIVYDGPGVFSSARVWWTFKVMGAANVRILQGGIDGWKNAGLPLETSAPTNPEPAAFNAKLDAAKVMDLEAVKNNVSTQEAIVIDARPHDRFTGEASEPRPGLKSGHIPGAKSLPFGQLFEGEAMKAASTLKEIFNNLGIDGSKPVVTSCGSGVTAAILTLGLTSAGYNNHRLYDGSWSEWGQADGVDVETGE